MHADYKGEKYTKTMIGGEPRLFLLSGGTKEIVVLLLNDTDQDLT